MTVKPFNRTKMTAASAIALGLLPLGGLAMPASAQEQPKAEAATEAAPASSAMATPAMTGPLTANPNPLGYEAGPLGTVYVTGAVSGLVFTQGNPTLGDSGPHADLSNGQFIVQTTEGPVQFFAQFGAYSFPAIGTPYADAGRTTGNSFGPVAVAYGKVAPSDAFSIQAGKLPTLIGAEYAFTFQNMNIERGLLWGQEPIVSRGVQANYTLGPLAVAGSLNDGFYSDSYNWLTGSAAWTIDKENTLTVVGGGNFDRTGKTSFSGDLPIVVKTPFFQNNGSIFNAIYTHNAAPWTITPYFQYTSVPKNALLGATRGAETFGGALLAAYALTENFSLAGRVEGIASTGNAANGAPSLLYGPGSSAWSLTLTPTYQLGPFFARIEGSYVKAEDITPGFAFGKSGTKRDQARFLFEAGVVF